MQKQDQTTAFQLFLMTFFLIIFLTI